MSKPIPPRPEDMTPEFYAACISVTSKRPQTVIYHILEHGYVTTEDLNEVYGYDHPPRAVRDVRDNGIPLETYRVISNKTGRQIAAYRFSTASEIVAGMAGGRKAFSKKFKENLIAHYGSRSTLTSEPLETRYLQIDHRVPYGVAGNTSGETIEDYMLLDASAQRTKSWSCEHCRNFISIKDPNICGTCFWAFPENYTHVAMTPERRLHIIWTGGETINYDDLLESALHDEMTPQQLVKKLIINYLGSRKPNTP